MSIWDELGITMWSPQYPYYQGMQDLSAAQQAHQMLALAGLGNALAPRSKRDDAIAYLRERKLYCLDRKQGRITVEERPQTLLDKWMKERHK